MCPLCITTLALAAAGASASGGLATFIVRKPRPKNGSKKHQPKMRRCTNVLPAQIRKAFSQEFSPLSRSVAPFRAP